MKRTILAGITLLGLVIAAAGGWLALYLGSGVSGVFLALAVALVAFGSINAAAVASGAWFRGRST